MALRLLASRVLRPAAFAPLASAARGLQTSSVAREGLLSSKTGQTGAAVLTAGMAAYLVSQEVIILHNETVIVGALGAVTYGLIKKAGPTIASELDARSQGIYDAISAGRKAQIAAIEKEIANQKAIMASVDGIPDFFDAVRVYEDIKREVAFREEKHAATAKVLQKLDTMVSHESDARRREQLELIEFLFAEVPKALAGKEDAILNNCIAELEALSTRS